MELHLKLSNIATTQAHAAFSAFGHEYVHNPSKRSRSWQNFRKILARIMEKLLQDSWQECLIIMQDPCKILARFLQYSCNNYRKSLQNYSKPCKFLQEFPKILQEFPKVLQKLTKTLARFFQDPCKILQELYKMIARITQESCKTLAWCMQDSWLARNCNNGKQSGKILAR